MTMVKNFNLSGTDGDETNARTEPNRQAKKGEEPESPIPDEEEEMRPEPRENKRKEKVESKTQHVNRE